MRVQDLLNEFAPPQPTDDELNQQIAQDQEAEPAVDQNAEQPPVEPVAQAPVEPAPAPVATITPAPTAPSIGQALEPALFKPQIPAKEKNLILNKVETLVKRIFSKAGNLEIGDPLRSFSFKLLTTISNVSVNLTEQIDDKTKNDYIRQILKAYHLILERDNGLEIAEKGLSVLNQTDEQLDLYVTELSQNKSVERAHKAHVAYIKLTAFEEIVQKDKELEKLAQEKAAELKLPLRWARNLIGMFDANMDKEQRNEFMLACSNGTALDLKGMMQAGTGHIDEFVSPDIQGIFNRVKPTLLDISLSSGQGAATGPFEALLAIMGGAKKAVTGDLMIDYPAPGTLYEVKSSSISLKSTTSKSKGDNISGGNSNAWLDASSEQAPSKARQMLQTALGGVKLPPGADFRPGAKVESGPLSVMSKLMVKLGESNGTAVLKKFHAMLYPDVADTKTIPQGTYNFSKACQRIYRSILALDAETIAKEQGVMAMLQYNVGHYQSNFILYNSSSQTFRVINGVDGIASLLGEHYDPYDPDPNAVHFQKATITIAGKGRKSAPGIYFGPLANSQAGEEYVETQRTERGFLSKVKAGSKMQDAWENGEDTPEYLPGDEFGNPVGKKPKSKQVVTKKNVQAKRKALKEVDSYILKYF
jgi:hypothetical protein